MTKKTFNLQPSDGYADLARELMKPDPVQATVYVVKVLVEKVVYHESGFHHVVEVPFAQEVRRTDQFDKALDTASKMVASQVGEF